MGRWGGGGEEMRSAECGMRNAESEEGEGLTAECAEGAEEAGTGVGLAGSGIGGVRMGAGSLTETEGRGIFRVNQTDRICR
jgi:hypothetical protein